MAVTNFRTVSPNTNHLLWQARFQQETLLWPQRHQSLTPAPEVQAVAGRLLTESPLAGYPGYRLNSQTRRFRWRYRAELQSLKDVASPMAAPPRRSEDQPSFISKVREELRSEMAKLHRRQRDRRLACSLSPTKMRGKAKCVAGINMGCWCPLPCLRWVIIAVSLAMLGCGGLIVWLGRRLQQQDITEGVDIEYYPLVIIAFGGWLIVVGFVGIVSAWRKNKWAVLFYSLLVISTTCVLIALAGVGLHLSQQLNDALESEGECKGNNYLRHANDAVLLANEQLCTPVCPCTVKVETFGEAAFTNFTIGAAKRIEDCTPCQSFAAEMQSYKLKSGYCKNGGDPDDFLEYYYSKEERRYFSFIKMLERDYRCAGICEDVHFFAFTDVNSGSPIRNCRSEIRDWVQVYPLRYCAVVVAVGLLLSFTTVLACCFFFHPYRKGMKGYDPAGTNTQV